MKKVFCYLLVTFILGNSYGQILFESHNSKESLMREATQIICQFDVFMRNNGIELPYKPGVRISTTYALIFWDSENKSVVLPYWHELYPEQIGIFNRWKGEEAQHFFSSLFNWFFIPHELGHFAMLTNPDLKISAYETERRANIFAITFLRNDEKNQDKLSFIEKSLNDVIKSLPPIDFQNMTEEEYFNANYQKLGNNPDSYAYFQFKFILDILKYKNKIPLIDLIKKDNISEY